MIKSLKLFSLMHFPFNWCPYLQLQNAKLNISNFTVTFNREETNTYILLCDKEIKPKKNKITY